MAYRDNGVVYVYPDGGYLTSDSLIGIWIIDVASRQKRQLTHYGYDPAWSPDGKNIAFESGGQIYTLNAQTGQTSKVSPPGTYFFPSWNPDGKTLVVDKVDANFRFDLCLIDVGTGAPRSFCRADSTIGRRMGSWSPDGRTLVCQSAVGSGSLELFSLDTLSCEQTILTSDPSEERFPQYSPDGSAICYSSVLPGQDILIMRADGSEPHRVVSQGYHPAWSPDGQRIVYQDISFLLTPSQGTLFVLDLPTGRTTQLTDQWPQGQLSRWAAGTFHMPRRATWSHGER